MLGPGDTKTRKKEASFLKEYVVDWGDLLSEQKIKSLGDQVFRFTGGAQGAQGG